MLVVGGADMGQLEMGRAVFRRHDWDKAADLLRGADGKRPRVADDLVCLAEAAWFAENPDGAVAARKRAHAGFLAQGDRGRAAEMALMVASDQPRTVRL